MFPSRILRNCIFIFLCSALSAQAFINVEEVRREAGPGFVGKSSVKIAGESGNSDKFASDASTLNIYRREQDEILFLGDSNYSKTLGATDTDNARVHVRYTTTPDEEFSWEYFVQSEFDQFRELKNRELAGLNRRQKLFYDKKESLYIGYGTFYEYQMWTDDSTERVLRGNFYLAYVKVIDERTSGYFTVYDQPSWIRIDDLVLQSQSGLKVDITTRLSVDLQLSTLTETRHPVGVRTTDVAYQTAVTLKY